MAWLLSILWESNESEGAATVVVGLGVVKIGGRGGGPLRGGSRNLDLSVVLGVNLVKWRWKDNSDTSTNCTSNHGYFGNELKISLSNLLSYLLKNSSKFTVVDGAMGIGVVVWMKRSVAIKVYSLSLSLFILEQIYLLPKVVSVKPGYWVYLPRQLLFRWKGSRECRSFSLLFPRSCH